MKFRFKALNKRRQPDQLDSPLLLASPRGWVAVFTVLITAVFIGLWGFLGSIPRTYTVSGVIAYDGPIVNVESPSTGSLLALTVASGQEVRKGATVATIRTGKTVSAVPAPVSGRVVTLPRSPGSILTPGASLLQIEERDNPASHLMVKLLVDATQVAYLRPGQTVTVAVPGVSPRAFGRLRGSVAAIGDFPMSGAEQAAVTGNESNAPRPGPASVAPRLVTVALQPDSRTRSGYAWTSAEGPPVQLNTRTPVEAEVDELPGIPILLTVVDGRVVHELPD